MSTLSRTRREAAGESLGNRNPRSRTFDIFFTILRSAQAGLHKCMTKLERTRQTLPHDDERMTAASARRTNYPSTTDAGLCWGPEVTTAIPVVE